MPIRFTDCMAIIQWLWCIVYLSFIQPGGADLLPPDIKMVQHWKGIHRIWTDFPFSNTIK